MKQNSVNCNAVNNSVTLKVQYQWQKINLWSQLFVIQLFFYHLN